MIGWTHVKAHHGHKALRKLAHQMQIVVEQIKLARLHRNLTVAQVAVSACHNKKRFPVENLSLFDPNFSAVVVQDKNRVAKEY